MIKLVAILTSVVLLSACSSTVVSNKDIEGAEEYCKNKGGFLQLTVSGNTLQQTIVCGLEGEYYAEG